MTRPEPLDDVDPDADSAPGVEIRSADRDDLIDIARIERTAFPRPWPFSAFERFLDKPGFLVARDESDRVAGYVVADDAPGGSQALGHVKDIAVRVDRRGEGVGALLLERALDVLGADGATSVKLEVRPSNEAARSLYESFDFEWRTTVPGYYADGEDALVYVRSLDDRRP